MKLLHSIMGVIENSENRIRELNTIYTSTMEMVKLYILKSIDLNILSESCLFKFKHHPVI